MNVNIQCILSEELLTVASIWCIKADCSRTLLHLESINTNRYLYDNKASGELFDWVYSNDQLNVSFMWNFNGLIETYVCSYYFFLGSSSS